MEIFKIGKRYFCKAICGFTFQKLEDCLDERLEMRKGSFAEQHSKQIFCDLFLYARDLRHEYTDYYAQEYDNFEQFLYQKELWKQQDIDVLELMPDQTVLALQMDLRNYNADTLMDYEESSMKMINQVLEEIKL
jgi:hypothetical protein